MQTLPEKIDSKYRFVLLASERAEQLMQGALPRLRSTSSKPTQVAMAEVLTDSLDWDYGPAPEPEVEDEEAFEGGGATEDEESKDES